MYLQKKTMRQISWVLYESSERLEQDWELTYAATLRVDLPDQNDERCQVEHVCHQFEEWKHEWVMHES